MSADHKLRLSPAILAAAESLPEPAAAIESAREADERAAWDLFAAALLSREGFGPIDATEVADDMLRERRKRWGSR
jgi:hypothetical protein